MGVSRFFLALMCLTAGSSSACTLIAAGKKATVDGSTMAMQTNDCINCDYRIGIVPSEDHVRGTKAPVWEARFDYPRYVGEDRGELYKLAGVDTSIFNWTETSAMGHIDQVKHTFAYLDGSYPLINERQVGFAESTCASKFVAKPASDRGSALFDISMLMRIASQRASTAREACQIMGELAVKYGYYGVEWDSRGAKWEAGEALAVIDPLEVWLFHVSPDDSGSSGVWVAQRIPDDHIVALANAYTIRNVNLSDYENFMGSRNMEEVAVRAGFWDRKTGTLDEGTFDFAKAYAYTVGESDVGITRRVWRVFDLAAPSLHLPADTDVLGSDYPVSVAVDAKLSQRDFMSYLRDHFEGTPYDLSVGTASGPYNDPNRYDAGPNEDGVTREYIMSGGYERSISYFRTMYSFVVVARTDKPFPMAWIGMYAPDAAVYSPFYALMPNIATSVSRGSLQKLDKHSTWWAYAAAGNYGNHFYKHAYKEFKLLQDELESEFVARQEAAEAEALRIVEELGGGAGMAAANAYLGDFSASAAHTVYVRGWELFELLLVKYKDGYRLDDPHSDKYRPTNLFVPLPWLQESGYFPNSVPSGKGCAVKYLPPPLPIATPSENFAHVSAGQFDGPTLGLSWVALWVVIACSVGAMAGVAVGMRYERRKL